MNVGRKIFGWLALLSFAAAVFMGAAGIFKPSLMDFAEPVLCTRQGQELTPNGGDDLRVMRRSVGSDVAIFCTSPISGVEQVTGRWAMICGALAVLGCVMLLLRAKVTPPTLRAPTVPVGG
ncbi:MAG: hypothetical protein KDB02_03105 [Acidimicrobiales bacterium]|nr:hypothetical protein [Acidimicrobiales bacterium]